MARVKNGISVWQRCFWETSEREVFCFCFGLFFSFLRRVRICVIYSSGKVKIKISFAVTFEILNIAKFCRNGFRIRGDFRR